MAPGTRDERGVTLIDVVIGTALMLLVFVGITGVFQVSVDVIANNRARAGAIALANERMEYLRSLSYTQIGVIGGIPAGNVPQEEVVGSNGISYTRRTMVLYSDDPQDGTGGADQNGIIADYKTIRVEVGWTSRQGERSMTLVGCASPPAVETAVPGGTLTISVVNAVPLPLSDAQVDIINTGTVPAINIRTYTNPNGLVTFIGAPAASDYQITVTRTGYSTAQTYPVTVQNPNPDPRHLTVANGQTTSATFSIDVVSTKIVETYRQIVPQTWDDAFANANQVATTTNAEVVGGSAQLAGSAPYASPGFVQSVSITPSLLAGWNALSWLDTKPAQTGIVYRMYDGIGALIPDAALPGNSAGFTISPINLSSISTTTYPSIRIGATLTTTDTSETPSVESWSVEYDYGPEPLPNLDFTMRGAKTIGNNPAVYKYDQTHSIGASASLTLPNIEWDSYTLAIPGTTYTLAESCAPQPEPIAPGESQTTRLFVSAYSAHSLLVDVRSNTGVLLPDASVHVVRTGYDVTNSTDPCGQTFFGGLANAAYDVTVSKSGYQTSDNPGLSVSGATHLSVVLSP